eukprot:GGOE01034964.1.p1 GENE.GGOE01034964.1~~GGOE01034964.1.p1  ORF type:complete len:329 (-),score=-24.63 GGOE01034964.1:122-1108(-)
MCTECGSSCGLHSLVSWLCRSGALLVTPPYYSLLVAVAFLPLLARVPPLGPLFVSLAGTIGSGPTHFIREKNGELYKLFCGTGCSCAVPIPSVPVYVCFSNAEETGEHLSCSLHSSVGKMPSSSAIRFCHCWLLIGSTTRASCFVQTPGMVPATSWECLTSLTFPSDRVLPCLAVTIALSPSPMAAHCQLSSHLCCRSRCVSLCPLRQRPLLHCQTMSCEPTGLQPPHTTHREADTCTSFALSSAEGAVRPAQFRLTIASLCSPAALPGPPILFSLLSLSCHCWRGSLPWTTFFCVLGWDRWRWPGPLSTERGTPWCALGSPHFGSLD